MKTYIYMGFFLVVCGLIASTVHFIKKSGENEILVKSYAEENIELNKHIDRQNNFIEGLQKAEKQKDLDYEKANAKKEKLIKTLDRIARENENSCLNTDTLPSVVAELHKASDGLYRQVSDSGN